VDRVRLRDRRAQQARHQVRRDRANLWELQRGVAEGAVVNRDLDALLGFRLLGQGSGAADPSHHLLELLVEVESLDVGLDGVCMPGGNAGEYLVERLVAAHLPDLLQDHRGQLPVALGEDLVSTLGERKEERGTAPRAPLRLADRKAVALEVREVLADGIRGDTEISRDGLGAGMAFAPEELQNLHPGRTAG